ncbi:hypothetical protein BGX38DRAFT_1156308 [Terfezia claveryi]|nr:hypothetical protein BGX38DRAFT_1156308 [Terfezia claveryi]
MSTWVEMMSTWVGITLRRKFIPTRVGCPYGHSLSSHGQSLCPHGLRCPCGNKSCPHGLLVVIISIGSTPTHQHFSPSYSVKHNGP